MPQIQQHQTPPTQHLLQQNQSQLPVTPRAKKPPAVLPPALPPRMDTEVVVINVICFYSNTQVTGVRFVLQYARSLARCKYIYYQFEFDVTLR